MATSASRLGAERVLWAAVGVLVGAATSSASVTEVKNWRTEVYPDEVTVTLRSDAPADEYMSLFCRTGSKRMGSKLSSVARVARFDAEPAEPVAPLEADVAKMIGKLAAHDRLLLRMQNALGQIDEVTFSLAGGAQALKPLVEGCGLPAELLGAAQAGATAPATPAAKAKAPPAERKRTVGKWEVLETTSGFDDRPLVMVSGAGLNVRCREGKLEAFIDGSCLTPHGGDLVAVMADFGGGASTIHESHCSTDGKARFLMEPASFLKEALKHPQVTISYRVLGEEKSLVVPLRDFPQALAPLRAACPFD